MPGRKSNLSTVINNNANDESSPAAAPSAPPARAPREGTSVEDLALPRTMISRLAKGVLPPNTSIHKDALLALSKSCTVFVNFLASNSNENAQMGGKKTIQPADVIAALKDNEFDSFIPRLEAELKKYNTVQCDKRNSYRRKIREEKAAATTDKPTDGGAPDEDVDNDADISMLDKTEMSGVNGAGGSANRSRSDDEPPTKKMRREAGEEDVSEGDDEFHDALEGEEDGEEEVVEGEGEGEEDEEEEGSEDEEGEEEGEDPLEDEEERVGGDGMRDEALDDDEEDEDSE